jgi:tetratricopeptide (TPR) repeat protein
MIRRRLVPAACFALLALVSARRAPAQIPDQFTNLRLLDPAIEKRELVATMRGFSLALGVRCNHCHVGPDDLSGMDFGSDEKATKRTARLMLEMVRTLNDDLLAHLPVVAEGDSHEVVGCYTCHRGREKPPLRLDEELGAAAAKGGVEAALARYDALRAETYGAGVYDFTDSMLFDAARQVMAVAGPEAAVRVLGKGLEHSPDSADLRAMIAMAWLQAGNAAAAKASLDDALRLDPDNSMALEVQKMLPPANGAEP